MKKSCQWQVFSPNGAKVCEFRSGEKVKVSRILIVWLVLKVKGKQSLKNFYGANPWVRIPNEKNKKTLKRVLLIGFSRIGGQSGIRTPEVSRQQIYSLLHLAALETTLNKWAKSRYKSHYSEWSWRKESNLQPADYKSAALPIEPRQHK